MATPADAGVLSAPQRSQVSNTSATIDAISREVSLSQQTAVKEPWYHIKPETRAWLGWSLAYLLAMWVVAVGYFVGIYEAALKARGNNFITIADTSFTVPTAPSYSDQPPLPWMLVAPGTG